MINSELMWIICGSIGGFALITIIPYLYYIKWKIDKKQQRKSKKEKNVK